jgi:transcriptional regulator with XRE-family HTH domain
LAVAQTAVQEFMIGAIEMSKSFLPEIVRAGGRIKKLREKLNKTQMDIALDANLSSAFWSAMETGRNRGSVISYLQVAKVLEVTLNDLFYDEADMIRKTTPKGWDEILRGLTDYEKAVLTESVMGIKSVLIRARKAR